MSTSEYGYRKLYDTATVGAENHPLDSYEAHALINNVNHLSDEAAQVRVAMSASTTSITAKNYLEPVNFSATPRKVASWVVPLTQRANGAGYFLRVRIGGASGSGGATRFYLNANAPSSTPRPDLLASGDFVFVTDSTTSTSAAWLTGSSQGPLAMATRIQVPRERIVMQSWPTLSTIGGNSVDVMVPTTQITVWATGLSASVPRLYTVLAAEVIGT